MKNRIQNLESYWQNNDDRVFKDQIIDEIDGIKKAVSDDIINLSRKIHGIEATTRERLSRSPDSRGTRSIKRSNNPRNHGGGDDSDDFERANESGELMMRTNKPQHNPSNSIIVMNSQKNLDSSLPRVSPNRGGNINAREDSLIHNIWPRGCTCDHHKTNHQAIIGSAGYEESLNNVSDERERLRSAGKQMVIRKNKDANVQPLKSKNKVAYSHDRGFH